MTIRWIATAIMLVLSSVALAEFEVSEAVKRVVSRHVGEASVGMRYFPAAGGLVGVSIALRNGTTVVAFTDAAGSFLITGPLFDGASGENLSPSYVAKYPPEADYTNQIHALASSNYIESGAGDVGRDIIYVFVDAKCPYCHRTYSELQKLVGVRSDITVRWIPVGILGPQSVTSGQLILGHEDTTVRATALEQAMHKAALDGPDAVKISGESRLSTNYTMFMELTEGGKRAVPFSVHVRGKSISTRSGQLSASSLLQWIGENKVAEK